MNDIQHAQQVLDAAFPGKGFKVQHDNPFYVNSDRMPRVGDIVAVDAVATGNTLYFLYTDITRWVGMNNAYPTNWVSVRTGAPDNGPNSKGRPRTLVSSLPAGAFDRFR